MTRNPVRSVTHIILLAAVTLFGRAVILGAHAELKKSEPAAGQTVTMAPPHVELWFSEDVDPKVSKIAVTGPSGKVAMGPAQSMEPKTLMAMFTDKLGDGTYTVSWQATAADDGHVTKGNFKFTMKQAKMH